MASCSLNRVNEGVCEVRNAQGLHVGNLKLIGGRWKFKAIGYGPQGELLPGGGPLTDRHNTEIASLDEAGICSGLGL